MEVSSPFYYTYSMAKIVVSNIGFEELLACRDVLDQLSADRQLDNLNAYLFYSKGALNMVVKEATSFANLSIKADIEGTAQDFGIVINYNTLFYVVNNYSKENLKTLRIEIDSEKEPHFKIIVPGIKDTLALPHMIMTDSQVKEIQTLIAMHFPDKENPLFSLFDLGEEREKDFIGGIFSAMPFISDDERKNNAFAIYHDRLIVNDRRHIFIYKLDKPIEGLTKEPISLHKKIARIFMILTAAKVLFNAVMTQDQKRVFVHSNQLMAILNNAISNIAPPTEKDVEHIQPTNMLCTMKGKTLFETSSFFNGFYKSNMEFKPLTLDVGEKGILFVLKDSGVSGYNSCNIERYVEFEDQHVNDGGYAKASIMNDSFLKFCKQLNEENVALFMDEDEKHPTVYLENTKRRLFMAKLKDS